MSLLQMNKDKQ